MVLQAQQAHASPAPDRPFFFLERRPAGAETVDRPIIRSNCRYSQFAAYFSITSNALLQFGSVSEAAFWCTITGEFEELKLNLPGQPRLSNETGRGHYVSSFSSVRVAQPSFVFGHKRGIMQEPLHNREACMLTQHKLQKFTYCLLKGIQ